MALPASFGDGATRTVTQSSMHSIDFDKTIMIVAISFSSLSTKLSFSLLLLFFVRLEAVGWLEERGSGGD